MNFWVITNRSVEYNILLLIEICYKISFRNFVFLNIIHSFRITTTKPYYYIEQYRSYTGTC